MNIEEHFFPKNQVNEEESDVLPEEQGGIDRQFGNQVIVTTAHHLQGKIVTKRTIQHHIGDGQRGPHHVLDRLQQSQNESQIGREHHLRLVAILAALRTPTPALSNGFGLVDLGCVLAFSAQDLSNPQGMGTALRYVHQREAKKTHAWHRLAIQ